MNRYNVTTILFATTILIVSISSLFTNRKYISDFNNYESINELVSYVFGENNAYQKLFISLWSIVNSGTTKDISLIEDAEYGNLIKDETGNIVNIKCQCSCKYANNGGSSTHDNFSANDARNLTSEPQP